MDNKLRRGIILFLFVLFTQSCIPTIPKDYDYGWELPITSHSLTFPESDTMRLLWTQEVYVENSVLKNVQCLATNDSIILVGSHNSSDPPRVFSLDNNTGSLLWEFDDVGVLAYSGGNVFIGSQVTVYSVDKKTGVGEWEKQLSGIGHITKMAYLDELLFINGSGGFYVLRNNGDVVSRYSQVSAFRSAYGDVPFYPTLPFGVIVDDDIQIVQMGDGLYSASIHDRYSGAELWMVDRNSISNFIIFSNRVLWIGTDGVVNIADKYSGNIVDSFNINPNVDFFNISNNIQHIGYYLCGNSQTNSLYIILGDSRQIFAVSLAE